MSPSTRRALTIDDPVAGVAACRVARPPGDPGADSRLREIALDEIHPNADQPRKGFNDASLKALADSIRERGVLQPILVKPRPAGYQLIAGERRWRASQIAGRQAIPALVEDAVDGAVSLELALIENVAREDLTVIEEARTIAVLLNELDLTPTVWRGRSAAAEATSRTPSACLTYRTTRST